MCRSVKIWCFLLIALSGCDPLDFTSSARIEFDHSTDFSLRTVTPTSGRTVGGTEITLSGAGFDSSALVILGDELCENTTWVDAQTLRCLTPEHSAGSVDVAVIQNSKVALLASGYTYQSTVPTLVSVSPSGGALGGGTVLTITGTDLSSDGSVTLDGSDCTSVVALSTTSLTCTTPAHAAGTVDIVYSNSHGESALLSNSYTYQAAPTVTSISPTAGALGGSTSVTITGTGFLSGASATIGGGACTSSNVVNGTTLTCNTPAHAAGVVDVVVTNSDTQEGTGSNLYTYQAAPTVTSSSPSAGALAGGTAITITGTGFLAGATATVGGNACGGLTVVNSTTITCTTAAHAAGSVDIVVTNTDSQNGTGTNAYTFQAAPTVTSISPTGGALAGSTSVSITGTGFLSGATATVGGNSCGGLTVVNSTTITCTTAAHAAGTVDVVVTNSDSQFGTGSNLYTFRAAPTVTSASPSSGVLAGGTSITITGTGFVAGATVTVGGSACTSVNVASATSITCDTPAHAAGVVNIIVTNADTQSGTGLNAFTYSAVTVTSVSPGSGSSAGGTAVTITGTGFAAGATAKFDGTLCTGITVVNATTITCSTPAHASGSVDVLVTNLDTTNGTGTNAYTYTASASYTSQFGGGDNTCFILSNGRIKCWGYNGSGELGVGDTDNRGDGAFEMGLHLSYAHMGTGRTAVSVSGKDDSMCAILDNGTLKCWGDGGSGILGYGNTNSLGNSANEMGDNLSAVSLGTGRTAVQVAAGRSHTCAVLDNGTLKCWGANGSGQLGLGDTTTRGDGAGEMGDNLPAVDLGTGRTALQVDVGMGHTCALLDNNTVKCWGWNNRGQLGQGDGDDRGDAPGEMGDALPAIDLGTGRTATKLAVNWTHSCVLLDNGTVKCFGAGGILGTGDASDRGGNAGEMGDNLLAIDLGTGRTAVDISSGTEHNCALLDNDTVKCWGESGVGQLGQGNTTQLGDNGGEMGDSLAAINLGTGRTAQAIHTGVNHTCVLLDNDEIKCFGGNFQGQLGLGDTSARGDGVGEMGDNLPVVDLGWPAQRIASKGSHSCYIFDDNTFKCWGSNNTGQLGLGNANDQGDDSGEMGSNLSTIDLGTGRWPDMIGTSVNHTCALLDNGSIKCWGLNNIGQLGLEDTNTRGAGPGEMGDSLPAVDLGTGRTAKQLAVGALHVCVLLDDNSVKCWGDGSSAQLGQGSPNALGDDPGEMGDALPTVDLGTGLFAKRIVAGHYHTCAILDDTSLKCWGENNYGQLGQEHTDNVGDDPGEMGDSLPVTNLGTGRTAVHVAAGTNTCAILDDDSTKCWGLGTSGQLGQGNTASLGGQVGHMGDSLPTINLGTGLSALSLSVGYTSVCALLYDYSTKCWGQQIAGSLGTGAANNTNLGDNGGEMGDSLPELDLGTSRYAVGIQLGLYGGCALLDNGDVKCWGRNLDGELGQEDTDNRGDNAGEMGDNLPAIVLE